LTQSDRSKRFKNLGRLERIHWELLGSASSTPSTLVVRSTVFPLGQTSDLLSPLLLHAAERFPEILSDALLQHSLPVFSDDRQLIFAFPRHAFQTLTFLHGYAG
jgi:hypothetical protein